MNARPAGGTKRCAPRGIVEQSGDGGGERLGILLRNDDAGLAHDFRQGAAVGDDDGLSRRCQ